MTRLTRHFCREEFACCCGCGFDTVDYALLEGLQELRDIVGEAIHVNSGCRCVLYNASLPDASPTSQHLRGRAADVWCAGYPPRKLAAISGTLRAFQTGGIGIYGSFVHLDTRGHVARWER